MEASVTLAESLAVTTFARVAVPFKCPDRRTLSSDKPHVETVTCYKLRAERAGELWARRWVDLNYA
jgi:hypothetical protein